MVKIIVLVAEGTEEIEALTVVDLARRAGIEVEMVSIYEEPVVRGSHNIAIVADKTISEADWDNSDMIVIPGGMPGTLNIKACEAVVNHVMDFDKNGKMLAAICAAPSILGELGLLNGKKAVCYPGFEDKLEGATVVYEPVVADGNIITSRGLGTAIRFAGMIINKLLGDNIEKDILNQIIY